MAYQIGTDEAGYGPNLGPLTVSGTLWQVEDPDCDLYVALRKIVSDKKSPANGSRLIIADSKSVYQSGGTIEELETTVLAICHFLHGRIPVDWQSLVRVMCGASAPDEVTETRKLKLPLVADSKRIVRLSEKFSDFSASTGIRLLNARCRTVFPRAFNEGVSVYGNKASLLSAETLSIVSEFLRQRSSDKPSSETSAQFAIICDKHGGRSKYAALLQEYVTDCFVTVNFESLKESRYAWTEKLNGSQTRNIQARFIARGESELSVALASMISKYIREVFMKMWNDFWQLKIPGIKPTKGYPVDARRFKKEIAATQSALGIADHEIWRTR